jgi:hypothetical protein
VSLVADEIETRIAEAEKLIDLFNRRKVISAKDVKNNFYKFNRAVKAISNNSKLTAVDTEKLVTVLEQERKSIPSTMLRDVSSDLSLFTRDKIEEILISHPKDQKLLNKEWLDNLNCDKKDELLNFLFDYSGFYKGFIESIAKSLDIKVCPYCNRNFITHVENKTEKKLIGPTFDHFFSQKDHPILAVSFYNLVPSCTPCNSSLKHDKEFDFETQLHPYFNSIEGLASFDFDLDTDEKKSAIRFKPVIKYSKAITRKQRELLDGDSGPKKNGTLNIFEIHKIYEDHYDIVEEVHEKFDINSPHHLSSIAQIVKDVGSSEDEFYRFHFGNYFEDSKLNSRPLSRLTRDIYRKMAEIAPLYPKD